MLEESKEGNKCRVLMSQTLLVLLLNSSENEFLKGIQKLGVYVCTYSAKEMLELHFYFI